MIKPTKMTNAKEADATKGAEKEMAKVDVVAHHWPTRWTKKKTKKHHSPNRGDSTSEHSDNERCTYHEISSSTEKTKQLKESHRRKAYSNPETSKIPLMRMVCNLHKAKMDRPPR